MEKLILMVMLSAAITQGISAQGRNTTQAGTRGMDKTKEMMQPQNAEHGQAVSAVAKETPSGPGKGTVVSTQAKTQRDAKKAQKMDKKKMKPIKENKGKSGIVKDMGARGAKKPVSPVNPATKGPEKPVPPMKK